MPYIEIKTNARVTPEVREALVKTLGEEIAILPGKTERWLMSAVEDEVFMSFAGDTAPVVLAVVALFGKSTDEAYAALTASLAEKLEAALGVPRDRIYVKYEEVTTWGWNGVNF